MKNRIYDYRRSVEVSQTELARAIGISRPYLSQIERGKYTPSEEVQLRLADYFDCALVDLFVPERNRPAFAWHQAQPF